MTGAQASTSFRLVYVPGVTPAKWVRIWNERLASVPLVLIAASTADASEALRNGNADAGFVRLPIERVGLSVIPLYSETTVVVVPKDHEAAAVSELSAADLADYVVLHPLDECLEWESRPGLAAKERPATTADAIELVAAGVGLLIVPQSLARLHHRKDLAYRPMPDAPESRIALCWPEAQTTDLVEDFIGIVRGRTANSSRGRAVPPTAAQQPPKPKRGDSGAGGVRQKAASGSSSPGRSGSAGAKRTKPSRGRRQP